MSKVIYYHSKGELSQDDIYTDETLQLGCKRFSVTLLTETTNKNGYEKKTDKNRSHRSIASGCMAD
ncbi:hypothetical protein GCM10019997_02900 [Prevotella corporis]